MNRVEVAGTAILYLAIMEPDEKRMVKEAGRMQREHVRRFCADPKPRKGYGRKEYGSKQWG